MKKANSYDEKYSSEKYYWGTKPSAMCDKVIEILRPKLSSRPTLIDLGCGEGRNAVHFAKSGFDVVGVDVSEVGLEKTRRHAREEGVTLKTVKADLKNYRLSQIYDVIFSTGTLHYLPVKLRRECFENYKSHTSLNGLNAFSVFVKKPFISRAPDAEKTAYPYRSGELMGHYWNWEILHCEEEIFDCASSGVPHKHVVDRVIAKKREVGR